MYKKYAPRCPNCNSEGQWEGDGIASCGGSPGFKYKFVPCPSKDKLVIKGGNISKVQGYEITSTGGTHE